MASNPRAQLTPQMDDYDRLPIQWLPYVMYLQASNYRSASVNTDAHGLRWSADPQGKPLGMDVMGDRDCYLLVGGSTVFGVGATADSQTLSANLSALTGNCWLNFAGRAFSPTQELILFQLFRNRLPRVRRILLFSGINALTLHHLVSEVPSDIGGFFYWSQFRDGMAEAMLSPRRRILSRFLKPLFGDRIDFARVSLSRLPFQMLGLERPEKSTAKAGISLDAQIATRKACRDEMMAIIERDLAIWRALADMIGAKLSFVLQPMFNWTGKKECDEEARLFSYLDSLPQNHFKLLRQIFDQESHEWLRGKLEGICAAHRIPFHDINALLRPMVRDEQWLFVDRAHMTDLGNRLVAGLLVKEGSIT